MKLPLLFFIVLLSGITQSRAQGGCKDPVANNYNPSALYNNGSCTYNTTSYTPPVKVDPVSSTLIETSGLQIAGDFLWSFNDGGNAAAIYRLDTLTGAILQTVNLQGAINVDWEDIGFDGSYFYIGDFGNNATGIRTDLKIYKFPLNAIPDYNTNPTVTIPSGQIEVISFFYSTQTDFTTATSNNTKYDCEAMVVDSGKIHLFSKNWVELNTVHYIINSVTAGAYAAIPVDTLATGYLVTGADKALNDAIIVLLGYQTTGFYNHFIHVVSDYSGGYFFNGNKRRIDLPNVFTMGQAEGICFRNSTYGYISNERISSPFTITQKLRSFNLQSFIPSYVPLAVKLLSFEAMKTNSANQLTWRFAVPVKDLQLLVGENSVDFAQLYRYDLSQSATIIHQPTTARCCYKLAWKEMDGSRKFSNTICVTNEEKGFQQVVLRSNGEFSFVANINETKTWSVRLLHTDGRLVMQTSIHKITAGRSVIKFGKAFAPGQLFILQITGSGKQQSMLLKVTD